MRLSTRLWLMAFFSTVSLILIGTVNYHGLRIQWNLFQNFYSKNYKNVIFSMRLLTDLEHVRGELYREIGVISSMQEVTPDLEKSLKSRVLEIRKLKEEVARFLKELDKHDPERQVYLKVLQSLNRFEKALSDAIDMALTDPATALLYFSSSETDYAVVKKDLTKLVSYEQKHGREAFLKAREINRKVLIYSIGILLVISIIAVFSSAMLSRYIVSSMKKILSAISSMSEGDFNVDIPLKGKDEFGILARSINKLAKDISIALSKVKDASDRVGETTDRITTISSTVLNSGSEMRTALDSLEHAIGELKEAAEDIAHNTTQAASLAGQTLSEAEKGEQVLGKAVTALTEQARVVRETSKSIKGLTEISDEIEKILAVIRDIADQTNLLALNAAIEAARAGEHGRGFAVVADEVRKLAETTTKSTQEIEDMISRIRSETSRAFNLMMEDVKQSERNLSLMEEVKNSFTRINNAIRELAELISQIAAAAEEQSQSVSSIYENTSAAGRVAAENLNAARTLEEIAGSMKALATDLAGLIAKFKLMSISSRAD